MPEKKQTFWSLFPTFTSNRAQFCRKLLLLNDRLSDQLGFSQVPSRMIRATHFRVMSLRIPGCCAGFQPASSRQASLARNPNFGVRGSSHQNATLRACACRSVKEGFGHRQAKDMNLIPGRGFHTHAPAAVARRPPSWCFAHATSATRSF